MSLVLVCIGATPALAQATICDEALTLYYRIRSHEPPLPTVPDMLFIREAAKECFILQIALRQDICRIEEGEHLEHLTKLIYEANPNLTEELDEYWPYYDLSYAGSLMLRPFPGDQQVMYLRRTRRLEQEFVNLFTHLQDSTCYSYSEANVPFFVLGARGQSAPFFRHVLAPILDPSGTSSCGELLSAALPTTLGTGQETISIVLYPALPDSCRRLSKLMINDSLFNPNFTARFVFASRDTYSLSSFVDEIATSIDSLRFMDGHRHIEYAIDIPHGDSVTIATAGDTFPVARRDIAMGALVRHHIPSLTFLLDTITHTRTLTAIEPWATVASGVASEIPEVIYPLVQFKFPADSPRYITPLPVQARLLGLYRDTEAERLYLARYLSLWEYL